MSRRRDAGDYPTPPDIAGILAAETLRGLTPGTSHDPLHILDPACGAGNLLLAVAAFDSAPHGAGLIGVEIDPGRAERARHALADAGHGEAIIICADALLRPHPLRDGEFDVVIANPPFLSPTSRRGAIPAATRAQLRERLGPGVAALTNMATIFLLDSLRLVRPGGRVGMILPSSFLANRDATGARAQVLEEGTLEWLWTDGEGVFDAAVSVCGVVITRAGKSHTTIRRSAGRHAAPTGTSVFRPGAHAAGEPWRDGVQRTSAASGGTIGDLTSPIAGFRRHYYAVTAALSDAPSGTGMRVVTAGLIDPGRVLWGTIPARLSHRQWDHPRVDADALRSAGRVSAWLDAVTGPKAMLATQTRVLECAVDPLGDLVPSVPVIALPASTDRAWLIAAALCSPHLSRLAFDRHRGAALSPDAIKVSASEAAELPIPPRTGPWELAAVALADAATATAATEWRDALVRMAHHMDDAYGAAGAADTHTWWVERLPRFKTGTAAALPG
ncbi:MAG: HsdM family class I SAM-dependent methyltransferase [Miltoncostaeaceae bacterium]